MSQVIEAESVISFAATISVGAGVQLPHVPAGPGGRSYAGVWPTVHHCKALGTLQPVLVCLHGIASSAEIPFHLQSTHHSAGLTTSGA